MIIVTAPYRSTCSIDIVTSGWMVHVNVMHIYMSLLLELLINSHKTLMCYFLHTVMAKIGGEGKERKQDWNGDEPVVKRRGFDTPSLISLSRPNSVTSSLLNDTNNIDVVNDDSDSNSTAGLLIVTDQNTSGRNTPDILKAPVPPKMLTTNSKSKTMATGKVTRPKKKGGSAAGAMAGRLAASQAAFAAYGVPYNHLLSSNNLLAVPSPVVSSNPPIVTTHHQGPVQYHLTPQQATHHSYHMITCIHTLSIP